MGAITSERWAASDWNRWAAYVRSRTARRPKAAKLALNVTLRTYVQDRLAGMVVAPGGAAVPGRQYRGKVADMDLGRIGDGRRPGALSKFLIAYGSTSRMMRRCASATRPSTSLFTFKAAELCAASLLPVCAPGGHCACPRARSRGRGKSFVVPEIMISERSAEAADRAVPGHWEGDLILGLESSAIGTLVERTTRFTMLLHLPRMAEHGVGARVKNGPALAGHGAEAVRESIADTIIGLPEQLRQSLTWDQGAEMAQHARLKVDTGLDIYFCDPHSPWQRGSNENTNGLLRQYFPKGTDLSAHSKNALQAVALALNSRPRKTLGWKTPAEAFDEYLQSAHMGVATTS